MVSILAFRRRLLSKLELVYSEGRGLPGRRVFAMSAKLRDELLTCALLVPVAATNLRFRPSPWLLATDASLEWEAEVFAEIGPFLSLELGLIRPLWTRLLQPGAARLRAAGLLEDEMPEEGVSKHCCGVLWPGSCSRSSAEIAEPRLAGTSIFWR